MNKESQQEEFRLIPKGTFFWSIKNQTSLSSDKDEIVKLNTLLKDHNHPFVTPQQLLFNIPGHIPTLINKGCDEWRIKYSDTLPYTIPEAQFPVIKYKSEN